MASDELKPCPFCGGAPKVRTPEDFDGFAIHVHCRCGAQLYGEKRHFMSADEAATTWNRRAQDFDAMRQRAEAAELELPGVNNAKMELSRLLGCEEPRWSAMILEATEVLSMRARVELLEGLLQRIVGHHIDGNIRPTVRDIINGMPDANDIYGYCEEIIAEIDAALAQQA